MPKRTKPTAEEQKLLKHARIHLRDANRSFHKALAAAHEQLDYPEFVRYQVRLKAYDRVRRLKSLDALERLTEEYRSVAKELWARVPNRGMPEVGPQLADIVHVEADREELDQFALRKMFVDLVLTGSTHV